MPRPATFWVKLYVKFHGDNLFVSPFVQKKLVATENPNEAYTTFTGVTRLRQGITPQNVFVDDDTNLSLAATLNNRLSMHHCFQNSSTRFSSCFDF